MDHRNLGYSLLAGHGIEIGALHNPAKVPACCKVSYCDAMSADDARRSFPELAELPLVNVTHIVDLDRDALTAFADSSQDFVILNHVIEHVANPIRVITECFRILKEAGKLVMSAPDMRFTFDRNRALTTSEHLWDEFHQGVTRVSDEHYAEFLRAVHPEAVGDPAVFASALISVRDRREHAHVWNSDTFQALLLDVMSHHAVQATPLLQSLADTNQCEYFSVWQKGCAPSTDEPTKYNPEHTAAANAYLQTQVSAAAQTAAQTTAHLQHSLHAEHARNLVLTDQLQAQAAEHHAELQAHQARQEALEQALQTCQALLETNRQLSAEGARIDAQTIEDKERHIRNIESDLRTQAQAIEDQAAHLNALKNSRSWRWTRPLRALSGRAR
jgi:SAM-dependent methyltransferase